MRKHLAAALVFLGTLAFADTRTPTIDDMVAATGWQKHTIRSALSHALAKKRGYEIVSDKPKDGLRIYKIAAAPKQ